MPGKCDRMCGEYQNAECPGTSGDCIMEEPAANPQTPADCTSNSTCLLNADEAAKLLHYPDCWDTAAYPTLVDAIMESLACSGCSECNDSDSI